MAGPTYRTLEQDDVETIRRLACPIFANDHERDLWTDGWMRGGDGGFLAEMNDAPVGVAWFRRLRSPLNKHVALAQFSLYVSEEHRRRRIATALMSQLVEAARLTGESGLGGRVSTKNEGALEFFSTVGFHRHQRQPGIYGRDEVWISIQFS